MSQAEVTSNEKVPNVSVVESSLTSDIDNLPPCDRAVERKLVHKFDWRLMPLFCAAYFFSALDRSNVGNANVAGMSVDIGITAQQYSNGNSLVYATYLPTMLPGLWLFRMFKKPRIYIGGMVMAWSIVSLCHMFIKNYADYVALRVLLGFFEGPYFSCMSFICTDYYFPHEFARRTSLFFVASALSGAFGGLIATGITKIHTGTLESWRYLFLIEGLLSFIVGVLMFFFLPDSPSKLIHSEEEKAVFENRTIRRKHIEGDHSFNFKELIDAFRFKTAASVLIQFCQDIVLYGFTVFLPSILNTHLGYSALKSQYLTVPVYIWAAICSMVIAEFSDRFRMRGPLIVVTNLFAIAAFAMFSTVKNAGVLYFALYLICIPLYIGPGLNESWIANNTAPTFKRGCAIGINQTLGNIAGAIAPQVFNSPPSYSLGTDFTLGCLCVSTATAALLSYYYFRRNKINQKILETGVDERKKTRKIGDDSAEFTFMI